MFPLEHPFLPIHHHWPIETISVLPTDVRMIPAGAVFGRSPFVCVGFTWGYGALRYTSNTIHMACPILTNTMEVKTATIVFQRIGEMDN